MPMHYLMGILLLFMAFFAQYASAQPLPDEKPVKPKALLIRPETKPSTGNNVQMVNDKYLFNAGNLQTKNTVVPPALPAAKSKIVASPTVDGVIRPIAKPLVITVPDRTQERVPTNTSFEEEVIVRYTNNDVESRMAGSRGEYIDVQRLPAQPNIRIRETTQSSPFKTASLPKADHSSNQEPIIIFFQERTSDLEVGQIEIIDTDILNILRKNSGLKASINGFAENNSGGRTANELSMSRAMLISEYLVNKGISSDRIEARAMGSNTPISPKNRVDVVLFR